MLVQAAENGNCSNATILSCFQLGDDIESADLRQQLGAILIDHSSQRTLTVASAATSIRCVAKSLRLQRLRRLLAFELACFRKKPRFPNGLYSHAMSRAINLVQLIAKLKHCCCNPAYFVLRSESISSFSTRLPVRMPRRFTVPPFSSST